MHKVSIWQVEIKQRLKTDFLVLFEDYFTIVQGPNG